MNEVISKLNQAIQREFTGSEFELLEITPVERGGEGQAAFRPFQKSPSEWDDPSSQGFFLKIKNPQTPPNPSPSRIRESNSQKILFEAQMENHTLSRTPPENPIMTPLQNSPGGINSQRTIQESISQEGALLRDQEVIHFVDGSLNEPFLLKNARVLFEAQEYALAKNIYLTLVQSGRKNPQTIYQLGLCFEAEGLLDEAQARFEEAIAFAPKREYHQRLATLLVRTGKESDAAELFERILHSKELSPAEKFELHQAAGNCFMRVNNHSSAENHFKKALEIKPNADEIRANLGMLFLQLGNPSLAKRHLQDALASNPKNHLALAGLGSCAWTEGDKRIAHDYFVQSLQIHLENPRVLASLITCAYEIKNFSTAVQILEEYIKKSPKSPHLIFTLAGLQFQLGRLEEAKSNTRKTLELQAQHQGALELIEIIEKFRVKKKL